MARSKKRRSDSSSSSGSRTRKSSKTLKTYRADEVARDLLDQMKKAGIACLKCNFITGKKGFSGKQAIRAHMKIHSRDRKAIRNGILVALVLITIMATLGVYAWSPMFLPL